MQFHTSNDIVHLNKYFVKNAHEHNFMLKCEFENRHEKLIINLTLHNIIKFQYNCYNNNNDVVQLT